MNFLRYDPLKEKLGTRTLTERESLPYLLATSLVINFPLQSSWGLWDGLLGLGSLVVTLMGISHVYRCNGGNEGFDFIRKFTVVGWIMGCRLVLVALPWFLLLGFLSEDSYQHGHGLMWYEAVLFLALEVFYYHRLGRHIADTR